MSASRDVREKQRRHRRSVRSRILETTTDLLDERPWADVSIDDVMTASGLSRTSFYRHFDDRQDLIFTLLADVGEHTGAPARRWLEATGDPAKAVRAAVAELADVYAAHGPVLRAIAEAAAHDAEIDDAYHQLADAFIETVASRIAADVAAGRSRITNPTETARALVWMNERYLTETMGRVPQGDADHAATVLGEIWVHTIYGSPNGSAGSGSA